MACVDVAAFPLQLLLRDHPDWKDHPVAVVDQDKAQGIILWVNQRARATGILPGMRYGAGLALSRHLRAGVVSRSAVDKAVAGLVPRLRRFAAEVEPSRDEPGVFWLGASGLSLLHPRLEEWAGLIHGDLAGAALHNTVAVGFSRFGSYAAAKTCDRTVVFRTPEEEHHHVRGVRLDRLTAGTARMGRKMRGHSCRRQGATTSSCQAPREEEQRGRRQEGPADCGPFGRCQPLNFAPKVRDLLARLGIHTLGGFLDLPASQVRSRLGREAHRLHRLAAGDLWSPLHPETPSEPTTAGVFLDYPEIDHRRLAVLMEDLLEPLLGALEERHEVMTALLLHLRLDDRSERGETLRPARPTLDRTQILELLRLRMEAMELSAGVTEIVMELLGTSPDVRQGELFHGASTRDHDAANRALARLRARFGDGALQRARPRAGHLPEARFTWEPMEAVPPPRPRRVRLRPLVRRFFPKPVRLPHQAVSRLHLVTGMTATPASSFPHLSPSFPRKRESRGGEGQDGRESPPHLSWIPAFAGMTTEVEMTSSTGPYIISGGWWGAGAGVHREYHFVRAGEGPWLWVYYDPRRHGWFLHGKVE